MSKAFVATSKIGDSIAVLPILLHEFKTTGVKPRVVTSKDYASLFDRVPFVDIDIFPGSWMDLTGALKYAKQRYSEVVNLSVFGKDFPIEQRTSSFQLEPYERAGVLHLWDKLPLEIDRLRYWEYKLPTIVFCDHSQSSPFIQSSDLHALLASSFPSMRVERMSMVRLPHIFEALEMFDAAKAIVCIDSAHLHLSAATKTPVAALAQDRPHRWHGSAWSKRFCFYGRYGEYEQRKAELIECLRDAISGKEKPEIVEVE